MKEKIELLHTEQRNPETLGIHALSTQEMLEKINEQDQTVALAVKAALPQVTAAVDAIAERVGKGGRMVYIGAGTSGRLGIMDSAECPPTYGTSHEQITCLMAGGHQAVFKAVESAEDSAELGVQALKEYGLQPGDAVVAAAASGRTPYCIGGLDYARSIGALAVSLSCNPGAKLSEHADVAIEVDTGCEVIMGSTRMKAGTAQKMVMNMLSTGVMIRCGRTCDNLMIYMASKNGKLNNRIIRLFCEATGCTDGEHAQEMLNQTEGNLAAAALMEMSGKTREEVFAVMEKTSHFYEALKMLA
jgi:N-acetylmuramic acid 6-phosphate etherase